MCWSGMSLTGQIHPFLWIRLFVCRSMQSFSKLKFEMCRAHGECVEHICLSPALCWSCMNDFSGSNTPISLNPTFYLWILCFDVMCRIVSVSQRVSEMSSFDARTTYHWKTWELLHEHVSNVTITQALAIWRIINMNLWPIASGYLSRIAPNILVFSKY